MSHASAFTAAAELRAPAGARFAILATRWNPEIVEPLVEGALRALRGRGVEDAAVAVIRVPGAWELPIAAARLAQDGGWAGLVALGCVIRGDTRHYEHVADECARGLMRVAIEHRLPVANGVLAVERRADAEARAGGSHGNKGEEAALAALELAALFSSSTSIPA
ncbi:6,7-dimethyl-8-ribityllumazine synthase [Coralloluteibacterium stylophorae]|uniref:6,7-dimethyl-8-ribityllumazine synthase n=1 Tax=Coralloluteibacterium stylophorae TaxID=1776034 RepID=A0A8J7VWW1_9GAMM|nr:6,7-dimethyl-8-ribityllumazine synthase [Coralloluteibacterium stylophorae]MBS7457758.1 6,7-dimethyl-8-ribityllumazine synthase [Coralloluteibacterium stylophorae]